MKNHISCPILPPSFAKMGAYLDSRVVLQQRNPLETGDQTLLRLMTEGLDLTCGSQKPAPNLTSAIELLDKGLAVYSLLKDFLNSGSISEWEFEACVDRLQAWTNRCTLISDGFEL